MIFKAGYKDGDFFVNIKDIKNSKDFQEMGYYNEEMEYMICRDPKWETLSKEEIENWQAHDKGRQAGYDFSVEEERYDRQQRKDWELNELIPAGRTEKRKLLELLKFQLGME